MFKLKKSISSIPQLGRVIRQTLVPRRKASCLSLPLVLCPSQRAHRLQPVRSITTMCLKGADLSASRNTSVFVPTFQGGAAAGEAATVGSSTEAAPWPPAASATGYPGCARLQGCPPLLGQPSPSLLSLCLSPSGPAQHSPPSSRPHQPPGSICRSPHLTRCQGVWVST